MGGKNMSHQASECVYVKDWDGEERNVEIRARWQH